MDLIRSWLAAVAAYFLASWLSAVYGALGRGTYDRFFSQVLWLYLPILVTYVLIAGAASAAHTRPHRQQRIRHLLAVLPVPVLAILLSTGMSSLFDLSTPGLLLSLLFAVVGTVAGWLGADLIWRRATRHHTYF